MKVLKVSLLIALFVFSLAELAFSEDKVVLSGEVSQEYSIKSTPEEVLKGIDLQKDFSDVPKYNQDCVNTFAGMPIPKDATRLILISKDLCGFINIGDSQGFWYDKKGLLVGTEVQLLSTIGTKAAQYTYPEGKLVRIIVNPAPGFTLAYNPKGFLIGYCISERCFDPNGILVDVMHTYIQNGSTSFY